MGEQDLTLTETAKKWHLSPENIGCALGTASAAGIMDVAAHLGPNGLFFGAVATFIAVRHGEDIVNGVRDRIPPAVLEAMVERFSRRPAQPKEDRLLLQEGSDTEPLQALTNQPIIAQPPMREDACHVRWDDFEDDAETLKLSSPQKDELFTFSQVLASGFVPTVNKIFVGRTIEGKDIFISAEDLCHVALAGKTGGGKCLEENELVFLSDGSIVPAKSLIGKRVQVIGMTDLHTMRQVPVLASFTNNGVRPVVEIELDNGIVLKRTEEHPLWSARLNKNQHVGAVDVLANGRRRSSPRTRAIHAGWVNAGDLRVCGIRPNFDGHVILCPTAVHQQGTVSKPEAEIILCAALLADGGLTSATSIGFTKDNPIILEEVINAAHQYDCILVPQSQNSRPHLQHRIVKTSRSKGGGRYAATRNQVLALVREWGMAGKSTYEKTIPSWVFRLPNEQIATFLRVFIDCDGWFDAGENRQPAVNVSLANPVLVQQVGQLALRLGITGTYRYKENGHAGAWTWSSPLVDVWQERIGSTAKSETLALAVQETKRRDEQAATEWNAWRQARPIDAQTFADCPEGYEWRKVVSVRRVTASTVNIEVHNDNHAFVGQAVEHNSSEMRLLLSQLCSIGVKVLLLNPHYMRWVRAKDGATFDEDWTPFEGVNPRTGKPYLEAPPIECADTEPIEKCLRWSIEGLLQKRKQEGREGGKLFAPYFIVLDEWPDVVSEIKKAPEALEKLLRQGRKYGIFVIVASQDFQVKTTGMEGGSVRKCLLTCFYTGGDTTTAKELLYSEKPSTLPENKIGKGTVMLRCVGTKNEAVLVKVPFVDNAAVYRLLGPSTFQGTKKQQHAPEQPVLPASQSVSSSLALTLDAIFQMYAEERIDEQMFTKLVNALPDRKVENDDEHDTSTQQVQYPAPTYLRAVPRQDAPEMEDIPMKTPREAEMEQVQFVSPTGRFTAALSPELQRVYIAYEPGKSHRDIARELGNISHPTVGKIIQRLKDKGAINARGQKTLVG